MDAVAVKDEEVGPSHEVQARALAAVEVDGALVSGRKDVELGGLSRPLTAVTCVVGVAIETAPLVEA